MRKTGMRVSGALMLVIISLMLASLACYSGQVPGVFELTPYSTPTQIPTVDNPRFELLETVLAPHEEGFTFFNMTLYPEPLASNLLNSKAICESNSSATILYVGEGAEGIIYYLVDCAGAAGWAAENRLAGPLKFQQQDLALTVSATGQPLQLLDQATFQPMISFMQCLPETVVDVQNIQVADADGDGAKEVYYLIECPAGNKGYVGNESLFGPVKVKVDDRALAAADGGSAVALASEPAPATDDNLSGECADGAVLDILEAKRIEDTAYYNVQCDDLAGWVVQANLIGPLTYAPDDFVIIYVPAQFVFADELPSDAAGEVALTDDQENADTVDDQANTTTADETSAEGEAETRQVVEYTPPAYLTGEPGPVILQGADNNVIGQCDSQVTADVLAYQGVGDEVYYEIVCERCTETDDTGACLTTESQQGWIEQTYLQGPLDYVPGDLVQFKSSSKAVMTDEITALQYARIPANITGASAIGDYTLYTGRCLYADGMRVTGVMLDKARTSNRFIFYFTVECEGQAAIVTYEEDASGTSRPVIAYDTTETSLISGYALGRDLVLADDER
ncbi:MAG: hypothetical protein JXA10_19160 [Anaerolineae bacterium]|nr:hypothetical protein [Anaerolineae bacterium]